MGVGVDQTGHEQASNGLDRARGRPELGFGSDPDDPPVRGDVDGSAFDHAPGSFRRDHDVGKEPGGVLGHVAPPSATTVPAMRRWRGSVQRSTTTITSSALNVSVPSPAAVFETTPMDTYGMPASLARITSG